MKFLTPGDAAPASVNRYLLPHEQHVITVRRHPAILLVPVLILFVGLVVAGVLTNTIAAGSSAATNIIWWAWLLVLVYFMWKLAEWAVEYIVITHQRILSTGGLLTRKVAMMPLTKVTDMSFRRSVGGRMLGYGEFVIESAGQEQALRNISYIPYPESLYLEVIAMIFPERESVEAAALRKRDEEEAAQRKRHEEEALAAQQERDEGRGRDD